MNFQSAGKNTSFSLTRAFSLEREEKTRTIGTSATAAMHAASNDEYKICSEGTTSKYSEVIRGRIGCISKTVKLSEI